MRPVRGAADYAPSRAAYRLQRIWLTPALRALVRVVLPLAMVAGVAAGWLARDGNGARLIEAAAEARRAVEDREVFRVAGVRVEGAAPDLAEEVRAALAQSLPQSLPQNLPQSLPQSALRLDLPAMREAVLALPRVAGARLEVRGGALVAEVTPRVPAILHREADGLAAYDAGGVRLRAVPSRAAHPRLPLIAGRGGAAAIPEALAVLDAAGSMAPRLAGLTRVGGRRWDAVLLSGQRVLLPEQGAAAAMRRAAAMDAGGRITDRAVTHLDLRLPGRAVLRLTPQAAAALREKRASPPEEGPTEL